MNEKEIIKKSKGFNIKILIIFIILFVVVIGMLYYLQKLGYDATMISFFTIIIVLLFINIFFENIEDLRRKKKIKKVLIEKYNGNLFMNKKPKNKIVYGDKTKVGNIRNKYVFSFNINNYACEFICYSREFLERLGDHDVEALPSYKYRKYMYINEYIYDLNKLGISINSNIINSESIKKIIERFSITKNIEVSLDANKLIIQKETMKNNYSSQFAYLDVDDIQNFYNEILIKLKEESYNGVEAQNIVGNSN